jgi:aspartyl/glutamyl-tRNA(Asn/Gln) amidotransferase C subunit
MSKFTKEMINDYADKLLIGLTDEENKTVLEEFNKIEKSMDLINQIPNIKEVEPMSYPFEIELVNLRDDTPESSLPIEDILKNCDDYEGREVIVPKVVN